MLLPPIFPIFKSSQHRGLSTKIDQEIIILSSPNSASFVLASKNSALLENGYLVHRTADLAHPSRRILVYPVLSYLGSPYVSIQNSLMSFLLEAVPGYILLYFCHIYNRTLYTIVVFQYEF